MQANELEPAQPFRLGDLEESIAPATPATNIAGGLLLVVIVLAMVPGAIDTQHHQR
jgi:hypothetical protein